MRSLKERLRHILFAADPTRVRQLVETETKPPVSIRPCAKVGELAPHLPSEWTCYEQRYLMMAPLSAAQSQKRKALPAGYTLLIRQTGKIVAAEVRDRSENLVASGRIVITSPYVMVDNIGTKPADQRRGLGTMVMTALNRAALEAGAATGLLEASPDGHALYSSVGWFVHTLYASAYLA